MGVPSFRKLASDEYDVVLEKLLVESHDGFPGDENDVA